MILRAPVQEPPAERERKLLKALDWKVSALSEEQEKLRSLLLDYKDIFALDSTELGSTDSVHHVINTGDHPPIRQQARCIPFALRGKVNKMVADMLDQGVIQLSTSP